MAKVAVLVPNQELELIAQPLTEEFSSLQVMEVKYIRTAYAVQRARELEQQGCDLIVARGVQARLIKRSVRIPLVEITVTPQELASVMLDLKEELELDCPRIGLIGFPNMFSGIIQVDKERIIRRVNRVTNNLLGRSTDVLLGQEISAVLPNLNQNVLTDALLHGKEAYAFLLDIDHRAVVVNVAPILVGEQIEGAVLTFQEGQRLIEMDSEMRRELYQRGFVARYTFENTICEDPETRRQFSLAKRISRFSAPVLLTGEVGSGKGVLAQCIHNESLLRKNAFITVDCSAWQPETVDNILFGNYTTRREAGDSYAEMAQDGTLYLSHVEMLPLETQYKLLCLIRGHFLHNGPSRPAAAHVRVIASTSVNLITRVEKGEFRSDLYYALSVLTVEVLPLRRRRGDIEGWMHRYLDEWQEKYKRYVSLTQGAWQYLREYEWPGNLDQLYSICERLVLLTQKRNIDETFLREQLEQMVPRLLPGTEQVVLYQDRRAVELAALMKKHKGNRQKVAEELGVSKTTLWRYLKKYDVHPDLL